MFWILKSWILNLEILNLESWILYSVRRRRWQYPFRDIYIPRDKNAQHQLPVPFCIYADLESVLAPIYTTTPNPSASSTTPIEKCVVCGAAYKIVSVDDRYYHHTVVLRGENVMDEFFRLFFRLLIADLG